MNLKEFFEKNNKISLGFSGGVDSSYLLYAAKKYGADVRAYFIKTPFQPQFELDDAFEVAKQIGIAFTVIEFNVLNSNNIAENDKNRCYYCKQNIFGLIVQNALKDGYNTVIDGTNASDLETERPGMKAIKELSVLSPLKLCGLTKDDVRNMSQEAGLITWNKPSYSCLATRVKVGESITNEKLQKIEKGEAELMKLGFKDFRLRYSEKETKLQVREVQMDKAIAMKPEITGLMNKLFNMPRFEMEVR